MRKDIHHEEALALILERVEPLGAETLPAGMCLGRVLAADVRAREAIPAFTNSAMDGFAVRAADLEGLPEEGRNFRVVGEVQAGARSDRSVGAGECMRIFTGAAVPGGADAVVPVELSRPVAEMEVLLLRALPEGANLRRAGSEMAAGETVLPAGTRLNLAGLGTAMTAGCGTLRVHRAPRVAVLPTGNELVEPGVPLPPGGVTNVNAHLLLAGVRATGAEAGFPGICPDTFDATVGYLREAAAYDLVLTSGGVSMGNYDFVLRALEHLGAEMIFWRVRQMPAKPLAFARLGTAWVLALPGNPASTMLGFELFARPLMLRLMGCPHPARPRLNATLIAPVANRTDRLQFMHSRLHSRGGELCGEPRSFQVSAMLRGMAEGNGYLVLSPETSYAAGDQLPAILLGWDEWTGGTAD